MGIVYSARDPRLNRSVALKMIRGSLSDPAAGERLRREARTAASVNHPNICQLYDLGEDAGDLYIVMEFVDGPSLAERLAQNGPLPVDAMVRISSRQAVMAVS